MSGTIIQPDRGTWWANTLTGEYVTWPLEYDRWYGPDEVPNMVYHGVSGVTDGLPGYNSTRIKKARRSIAHMLIEEPVTQALRIGSPFHTLVLEGEETYRRDVQVAPYEVTSRRCKAWREWLLAYEEKLMRQGWSSEAISASRQQVEDYALLVEDDALVKRMADAVMSHSVARSIIEQAEKEQSLWYIDEETGLLCKERTDLLLPDILGDLKSTRDARPEPFMRDAYKYGYHISASHYQVGAEKHLEDSQWSGQFLFIAVESAEPHGVQIHLMGLDSMALGRFERDEGLVKVLEWEEAGRPEVGPVYPEQINEVDLPRWALVTGRGER